MTALAELLLEAGLIQFGWFHAEEDVRPVTLHLDMLVSYPHILEQAAREALSLVGAVTVNRLLCTAESIPFGVAVSLQSGVPLVYSQGTSAQPVFDLVGAYDIGHPALLLTNSVGWHTSPPQLVGGARRVGLEVHTLVTILEVRSVPHTDDLALLPLIRLVDVVRELSAGGRLSGGHARAVLDWLADS